jgi:predicted dehydrogenase
MRPIRVGVIGAGRMGRNHCRIFSALRHAELAGVTDIHGVAAQGVAHQYETTAFPTVDALLTCVDAVSIATPTPSHFSLACICLERGLHLFIEKPMTATLAEAEALVTLATASQRVVQVGHIERFNPTYSELKHVIEGMPIAAINFRRLSPYAGSNLDVDVILDLMIHDLDLVLDLIPSPPQSIQATGISAFGNDIDHATAQFIFAEGPLLTLTVSRLTEHKVRSIEVTGLEAYVEGDLLNKSLALHRRMTGEYLPQNQHNIKYRQESVIERIHVPLVEPLFLELEHFIRCICEKRQPLVAAVDGLNALKVAMYIRDQIQGRLIPVTTGYPSPFVFKQYANA